jgi:predicted RND superfamily exporter protein
LVLVGCLCSQIPKIQIDVSPEALLRPNDPTRLLYNDFREQFGRPELIVIAIESPSIFSEMFLSRLKSLHQDLEDNVPFLYNFNKYYQKTGIVADAVAETMLGTGGALLMTSIILNSGFPAGPGSAKAGG